MGPLAQDSNMVPTTKEEILFELNRGRRLDVFAWVAARKVDQETAVEALTEYDLKGRSFLGRLRCLFT